MQPKLAPLDRVVEEFRRGHEQTLEHVCQVAHGELIVEVDGSLAECGGHLVVEGEGSLQDLGGQLLHAFAEVLEVALQEGAVDLHEGVLPREVHRQSHEQPLQAGVDLERARGGVHARHVLRVVDVLLRQLVAVKPVAPAQVLSDEGDGHGGFVGIQLRHVQVVHKVDEGLCAWRTVVHACLLLQGRLQHLLERYDVREVVEADAQRDDLLWQAGQLAFHKLRLPHARTSHKHNGLAQLHHHVQEVPQGAGFGRGHKHSGHGFAAIVVYVRHQLCPGLEFLCFRIHKVVVHCALARDLHSRPRLLEPLVKVAPVIDAIFLAQRASKRPDQSKNKVHLKQRLVCTV
mmetsp:Transcript_10037/g.27399  ORF Transcript_10037/g.27399 Transcript_10037/m.27399 type:complete len:345 (+) Transcript_10037:6589-7623(+)